MGFKKFLGKVKDKYNKRQEKKQLEQKRDEEKNQLEQKLRRQHEDIVNKLLDQFEIRYMHDFFKKYLNRTPEASEDNNGGILPAERRDYIDFAWKYLDSEDITYDQLKRYALKTKIVVPSFFSSQKNIQHHTGDFELVMDSIRSEFKPETIPDEEHLEAQLVIFLKAKFPKKKVLRQVTIQGGDKLDVLVDDRYVFELKVPKQRSDLRNLGAQLEEYQEKYPDICAVIFDAYDLNMSQDIIDYSDKYRRNYDIPSIILSGKKRQSGLI